MNEKFEFQRGLKLYSEGRSLEALGYFQKSIDADGESPEIMSYYAVANALERGQIRSSIEMASKAIEKMPDRADFYLNLGNIYLKGGEKKAAVETFRQGVRVDPENKELHELLKKLGIRRKPLFSSLPRSHKVNRFLGKIAHMIGMSVFSV